MVSSQGNENERKTFEVRIDTIPECMIDHQDAVQSYVATWGKAASCLSNWTLDFGIGQIEFVGDWANVANVAISNLNRDMRILNAIGDEERQCVLDEIMNLPKEETPIIRVQLCTPQEMMNQDDDFLCMYLMNCFLALNLSAPGCAMMHAEFQGQNGRRKIELHELNWFPVWNQVWPVIRSVPLAETMKWLSDVRFGKGQLAETAVERLLIALLRVSDGEMWGPEHVLWLSQALEAIVISPVERVTSTLQQRLIALLGAPPSLKKAKKKITSFYALRSRIAHGDFQFIHPMGNEIIDPRINSIYDELSQAVDFGMAVSVAIAQMLVRQRWRTISFSEEIRGTE